MVKLWYPEADAVSWSHSSNHLSLQHSHANWHLHEQSWKGGRGNPHCSQWHQPLWKSCPCPLYINQCQSQHQPGFQQDTQPREDTPGCWMVSCSGGSSKGTLLTFTEISVPLQGMQYIIPIFFTVLKRQDFFFLPSWLTMKKTFLLFVCTDPAASLPTTMHFLFTEKKVDLKEIYRTYPWACLLHRE